MVVGNKKGQALRLSFFDFMQPRSHRLVIIDFYGNYSLSIPKWLILSHLPSTAGTGLRGAVSQATKQSSGFIQTIVHRLGEIASG
jgi:hypothetical protein